MHQLWGNGHNLKIAKVCTYGGNNEQFRNILGTVYPAFCNGILYSISYKTGIILADVAREIELNSAGLEDSYLTGYQKKTICDASASKLNLKSVFCCY